MKKMTILSAFMGVALVFASAASSEGGCFIGCGGDNESDSDRKFSVDFLNSETVFPKMKKSQLLLSQIQTKRDSLLRFERVFRFGTPLAVYPYRKAIIKDENAWSILRVRPKKTN